jgi:hypothetical protein
VSNGAAQHHSAPAPLAPAGGWTRRHFSMPNETVDPLEQRVARLEDVARITRLETVAALRADLATITEAIDPNLTQHVAELDARLEQHGLL